MLAPGNTRIPIAWQVNEVPFFIDEEMINRLRFARGRGGFREILTVHQQVNQGGFSHVGASNEGKFVLYRLWALRRIGVTDFKIG